MFYAVLSATSKFFLDWHIVHGYAKTKGLFFWDATGWPSVKKTSHSGALALPSAMLEIWMAHPSCLNFWKEKYMLLY